MSDIYEGPSDRPEVVVGTPGVETPEEGPPRFTVGDRSVTLSEQVGRPAAVADLVRSLVEIGRPVAFLLDPGTDRVAEVRVPLVARVGRMREDAGRLAVELVPSQTRFEVVLDEPGERIAAALRDAAQDRSVLVVTADDRHRILDARPVDPELRLPPWVLEPLPPSPAPPWYRRFLSFSWTSGAFEYLAWLLFPISSTKARQVFDALSLLSCEPVTVPAPCIPFRYPDDGCWGRAHEMCRLMTGMSVRSRKVWIQGWLTTPTKNHPSCEVHWGWHVAPTVRVRSWWFLPFGSTRVVDPALFTAVVSQTTWKGVQGDPNATLTGSSRHIFYLWGSETDADNSKTEGVLATYRGMLQARSLSAAGPPPYAACG